MSYKAIEIEDRKLCPVQIKRTYEICMRPVVKGAEVCKLHLAAFQREQDRIQERATRQQRDKEERERKQAKEQEHRDNLHSKLYSIAPNFTDFLDNSENNWYRITETRMWEWFLPVLESDRQLWMKAIDDVNYGVLQDDLKTLLTMLGMPDGARNASPHEVFQEVIAVLKVRLNGSQ